MRAVRVRKKGSGKGFTFHWLTDYEGTCCGRELEALDVVEEAELEELPSLEACHGCTRAVAGGAAVQPDYQARKDRSDMEERTGAVHYALPAIHGRLRKVGPLRKGSTQSGRGNPLR
jgi:hypothetical protein